MSKRDIQISKSLSYLLRHGAVKEGLSIDSSGYVNLSEVLAHNRLRSSRATQQDIERIVQENDKKRFTLIQQEDVWKICANQGHSLRTVGENNLTLLTPNEYPERLIHGTTRQKLDLILQSGALSKMDRNHIHFTSLEKSIGEQMSGIRGFSTVLIYIDLDKFTQSGLKLYKSLNDVYLSPGDERGMLSKELFGKIVDRKTGEVLSIP
jgi:2'-phosphotransferase